MSDDIWWKLPDGPIDHKLPSVILPVGTTMYRADREGAKSPSKDVPAFFTTKELLHPYKTPFPGKPNLGDSTISSYTVTKEAKLFHMTLNSLIDLLDHPKVTEEDEDLIMKWYNFTNKIPYIFPSYVEEKNVSGTYPMYANRHIANLICRLGYDGWIVKPFHNEKRTGLLQVSVARVMKLIGDKDINLMDAIPLYTASFPKDTIIPYNAEIMLCNWNDVMNRVTGGKRKTRKTKRYRT